MNYPDRPHGITSVLVRGRQEGQSQRRRREDERRGQSDVASPGQECMPPWEMRKRQGNGLSLGDSSLANLVWC